jgi:hypothetical protein
MINLDAYTQIDYGLNFLAHLKKLNLNTGHEAPVFSHVKKKSNERKEKQTEISKSGVVSESSQFKSQKEIAQLHKKRLEEL